MVAAESPHATRVEGLFHLVREGSSAQVRANAAEKLGEIALQSPVYCRSILQQIRVLVVDSAWDVRIAAAKCLEVIAASFSTENDGGNVALRFANASFAGREASCPCLNHRTVDITQVLSDGAPLLRSGGEEYAYQSDLSEDQRRLQAVRQRHLLLRRICGASSTQLWRSSEDALAHQLLPRLNTEHVNELADDIETSETGGGECTKMKEEGEETKRKRADEMLPPEHRAMKKAKMEEGDDVEKEPLDLIALLVVDLLESCFDSKWEVRHGSLTALRQILLSSKMIAGLDSWKADRSSKAVVDQWIEESLMRCLCVLALDQFVDYSADGSVAPVRELGAQVFGILLGSLIDKALLQEYLEVLRVLLASRGSWHAAHGGLLGVKYLIQAHRNHGASLTPLVFSDVVRHLRREADEEEDIEVVSAGILGDVVEFVGSVDGARVRMAWQSLWSIVDVNKSTGGLVTSTAIETLRHWCESAHVLDAGEKLLHEPQVMWRNVVNIVPMLHHHTASVRRAAASCLAAVFNSTIYTLQATEMSKSTLGYLLPHVVLQILREDDEAIRQELLDGWASIIQWTKQTEMLVSAVKDHAVVWMELVWKQSNHEELNSVLDGIEAIELAPKTEDNLASRVAYADALACLLSAVPVSSSVIDATSKCILQALRSSAGEQQCGALLLLMHWAQHCRGSTQHDQLRRVFGETLDLLAKKDWAPVADNQVYYVEQRASLQRVQRMDARLRELFTNAGVPVVARSASVASKSAAMLSRQIAEQVAQYPYAKLQSDAVAFEGAHFRRQDLFLVDDVVQRTFAATFARVQGLGSCAYCLVLGVPVKKSGFLVKALMEAIKNEASEVMQTLAAQTIADFVVSQHAVQKKCVAKILMNLCNSAAAFANSGLESYPDTADEATGDDATQKLRVRVRGAELALRAIVQSAGDLAVLPILPTIATRGFDGQQWTETRVQQNGRLVQVLAPALPPRANNHALQWLGQLCGLTAASFADNASYRAVANAVAAVCRSLTNGKTKGEEAMAMVYERVLVHEHSTGAVAVVDRLVTELPHALTPYVPSLLHFVMKAMHTATNKTVRQLAAKAFADLVLWLPLQMDLSRVADGVNHPGLLRILQQNQSSRGFLERLLQGKAIDCVQVDHLLVPSLSLREYQQHGVDWLCFLAENHMGGVLADDMGLGKTIQILAAIAARTELQKAAISVVVCPPIVVHHWIAEATRCFPRAFDTIVDLSGTAAARRNELQTVHKHRQKKKMLIVTTYAAVRSDAESLSALPLDFLILDEAHLIRNPKSSLFAAVTSLQATHRFALSGTPLQNHVGDLWALFSFLMPGYLGEHSEFRAKFELPIRRSRDVQATAQQKEKAAIAINELHQRVLPFLLRRTKDQVLKELPPKIISNRLLTLSPVQRKLYDATVSENSTSEALKSLSVLKKICVHPSLADSHSQGKTIALSDWKQSGKMLGLYDLLVDECDLGPTDKDGNDEELVDGHRCLIFGHLIETLDAVEAMLSKALPHLRFLRLDGSTPSANRAEMVATFNRDPFINVLLLTTAVGGLGLTLTGADTVVFVEHAWNPFVDLQAMDRAHRLGQKKTVRVFRLIMQDTLEEHIMDLQRFKERVASTVVAETDADKSMDANTKNVLQLLHTSSTAVKAQEIAAHQNKSAGTVGLPGAAVEMLDKLGEMWNQSQYDSLAFPDLL